VPLGVPVAVRVSEGVGEGDGVQVDDAVIDSDALCVWEDVTERDGVRVWLGESVGEGVGVGDVDMLGLFVADALGVLLVLPVSLRLCEGLCELNTVGVWLGD